MTAMFFTLLRIVAMVPAIASVLLWTVCIVALIGDDFDMAGAPVAGRIDAAVFLRLSLQTLAVSLGAALLASLAAAWPASVLGCGDGRLPLVLAVIATGASLFVSPAVFAIGAIRLVGLISGEAGLWLLDHIYSFGGAALILAWYGFPVAFLCQLIVWRNLPREIIEAGQLDASGLRFLFRVKLPLVAPGLLVGGLFVFLLALIDFNVGESLGSLPLLVARLYVYFGVYFDPAGAALIALFLMVLASLGAAFLAAVVAVVSQRITVAEAYRTRRPVASLLALLMVLSPLALLLGILLFTAVDPSGRWAILQRVLSSAGDELLFTMGLALLSAGISLILGLSFAFLLQQMTRPWIGRLFLLFLFVTPGPVIAIGMKSLLLRDPADLPEVLATVLDRLDDSVVPLLLAWSLRFAALPALVIELMIRRIPSELCEAVTLESRSPIAAFRVVFLPVIGLPAVACALAAGALTLGEVGAAVLLIPPGTTTIGIRLMTLMHYAPAGEVSALSLLVLAPALLIGMILSAVLVGRSLLMRRG